MQHGQGWQDAGREAEVLLEAGAGTRRHLVQLPVLARVSRVRLLAGLPRIAWSRRAHLCSRGGRHQQGSTKTQPGSCRNDPQKELQAGTKDDAWLQRATTSPGLYSWL